MVKSGVSVTAPALTVYPRDLTLEKSTNYEGELQYSRFTYLHQNGSDFRSTPRVRDPRPRAKMVGATAGARVAFYAKYSSMQSMHSMQAWIATTVL